jgi:hypothetical protein
MRRIESTMACLLSLALLHASARSTAWGQEDLLAQQRAISAIKRVGGDVERYEDGSGTRGLSVQFRRLPDRPPGTDLSVPKVEPEALIDSELRHLKTVPHLKSLSLEVDWVRISGAGLEHVRGLKELQSLDISFTYFPRGTERAKGDEPSISGLKYIRGLERLESLYICLFGLSGAALRDIKDLPRLESLTLLGSEITDADLEFLRGLKSLKYLSLDDCPGVTAKGIMGLKRALPKTRIDSKFP